MTFLRLRWIVGSGLGALAAGIFWAFDRILAGKLLPASLFSGAALFLVVLWLAIFNGRKKLPFLPLARASSWLQFHIYAGFFSVALFLIHCHLRWPRGVLETVLAAVFVAVALSGMVGLALSRWLPAQLTAHSQNVIFERIPALRHDLKQQAEALALSSVPQTQSTTIADFYEQRLRSYFERPRLVWLRLTGHSRPSYTLLSEVEELDRYLDAEERKLTAQIAELIRQKETLDFQLAAQGLLKLWLFVHIPLTYALILLAFVHGLLAWSFT